MMYVASDNQACRDDAHERGRGDGDQRRKAKDAGVDAVFHSLRPNRRQCRQRAQHAERRPGEAQSQRCRRNDDDRVLRQEDPR